MCIHTHLLHVYSKVSVLLGNVERVGDNSDKTYKFRGCHIGEDFRGLSKKITDFLP